jgi:hypothetical protein
MPSSPGPMPGPCCRRRCPTPHHLGGGSEARFARAPRLCLWARSHLRPWNLGALARWGLATLGPCNVGDLEPSGLGARLSDILMPQSLRTRGGSITNRDCRRWRGEAGRKLRGLGKGARATAMVRSDSKAEPFTRQRRGRVDACRVTTTCLLPRRVAVQTRATRQADRGQQTLAESAACEAGLGRAIVEP